MKITLCVYTLCTHCVLVAERGQSVWAWPGCSDPCTPSLGNMDFRKRRRWVHLFWNYTILFPSLPKRGCQDHPLHTLPFLISACAFWSSQNMALEVANMAGLWMQPQDAAPRKGAVRPSPSECVSCSKKGKERMQLQNVVLKESGCWAQQRRHSSAQSEYPSRAWPLCSREALQCGVVWCRWSIAFDHFFPLSQAQR